MDPQQQYCLKWNSYSSNLASSFSSLFKTDTLTDVTVLCGDTVFKAHKLILAACSKKFHDLFGQEALSNAANVCVILEATTAENMSSLLEFMYKGEVHVSHESLSSFLKAAETLQVKGLSIEHGRLTAHSHGGAPDGVPTSLESPSPERIRQQRNSLSGVLSQSALKQECDSLMQHATSSGIGGFPTYIPQIYRPHNFDHRKRTLRSPFTEQEMRDSVLRDGSKASSGSVSPISKVYRPGSSASTTAPTEADTMQTERVSPQQSRYENHSPPSTTAGNGNGTPCPDRIDRKCKIEPGEDSKEREMNNTGAEDLRIKMETDFSPPARPTSNTTTPQTPTTPVGFNVENSLDGPPSNLPSPAEIINASWPAAKLANKGGSVNTADGKKLRCPLCERLYGYETNLRAHIRQRHQGIRVPCPFCTRTFTRNNTVRRHIAREHKNELNKQYENNQLPPNQAQPSHTH